MTSDPSVNSSDALTFKFDLGRHLTPDGQFLFQTRSSVGKNENDDDDDDGDDDDDDK